MKHAEGISVLHPRSNCVYGLNGRGADSPSGSGMIRPPPLPGGCTMAAGGVTGQCDQSGGHGQGDQQG